MARTLTARTAVAAAAIAMPTAADARGGRIAAGIIGGLAAGAIIGGVLATPNYGPHYGGPHDYGATPYPYGCHWQRQRIWVGFGWAIRRVRVCY